MRKDPRLFIASVPTRYDPLSGNRIPSLDFIPAAKYGHPVELTERVVRATQHNIEYLVQQIEENIKSISPNDYIVAAGDPALTGIAMHESFIRLGMARVLRWDRNQKEYELLEVAL